MILAAKVWASDENEPEGLFNKTSCPTAPPNWFREEPVYAAELYALERYGRSPKREMVIHVRDTDGVTHTFRAEVGLQVQVSISSTHQVKRVEG